MQVEVLLRFTGGVVSIPSCKRTTYHTLFTFLLPFYFVPGYSVQLEFGPIGVRDVGQERASTGRSLRLAPQPGRGAQCGIRCH